MVKKIFLFFWKTYRVAGGLYFGMFLGPCTTFIYPTTLVNMSPLKVPSGPDQSPKIKKKKIFCKKIFDFLTFL